VPPPRRRWAKMLYKIKCGAVGDSPKHRGGCWWVGGVGEEMSIKDVWRRWCCYRRCGGGVEWSRVEWGGGLCTFRHVH